MWYVDASSTNTTPPFTTWDKASPSLFDTYWRATAGDTIWVYDGTYTLDDQIAARPHVRNDLGLYGRRPGPAEIAGAPQDRLGQSAEQVGRVFHAVRRGYPSAPRPATAQRIG